MQGSAILRPDEIKASDRGGGARTKPMLTRRLGARSFINGTTYIDGGSSIPMHTHNCEEAVIVLKGSAVAEIGDGSHELSEGDVTVIAAGIPHRFRNASETEPLSIFWTYGSVDATRTLVATGDERSIDTEHA